MKTPHRTAHAMECRGVMVALGLALATLAAACDGPVTWVVSRETLVKPGCPSTTRALVFEYQRRGKRYTARGEVRLSSLPKDPLLAVYPTITGSPGEWGSLTVRCPRTGETLYQSGRIQFEKAFCGKGFLGGLVFLDGLPPGATEKRCCPKRSSCPLEVHHVPRLLR